MLFGTLKEHDKHMRLGPNYAANKEEVEIYVFQPFWTKIKS
jgi:hypothetical protein